MVVCYPMGAVLFQTRYSKRLTAASHREQKASLLPQGVTQHLCCPQTCGGWSGAVLGVVVRVEHPSSVRLGKL